SKAARFEEKSNPTTMAKQPLHTGNMRRLLRSGQFPGYSPHRDVALASDGLESNDKGRLYLTDYEHHALLRRNGEGISANTNAPHFPPSTAPAPPASLDFH
ncbi:MAG TPA: hypothetical protein VKD72_35055, partial [Gemmataceae bacterium]|nr:hypothetical protein [Gemmataceae bacterium]